MKLATYKLDGDVRGGFVTDDSPGRIYDLERATRWFAAAGSHRDRPILATVEDALEGGTAAFAHVRSVADAVAEADVPAGVWNDLDAVSLMAPVRRPPKVICAGLNYRAHAEESGQDVPDVPVLFTKFPQTVIGPSDDIVKPALSDRVDYEGEVALVLFGGPRGWAVTDPRHAIAGVTIMNDVSARDFQMRTSQWLIGKAFDTFAPMGPFLVPLDDLHLPLTLETRVNGELRQAASTADLIFDFESIVAFMSGIWAFEAGDVLATGTPSGVGVSRVPPTFLEHGDVVEVSVAGIGAVTNVVVAEPLQVEVG